MVRQQSSAAGVLALLQEPDPLFKQHALKALNPLVPQFWAEISEHIGEMYVQILQHKPEVELTRSMYSEALYESNDFPKPARDAAALLASKVYYFLGEYEEALSFALGAGSAFQAEARTVGSEEYVETIVCE